MRSIGKSIACGLAGLALMNSATASSAAQGSPVEAQQPQNPWMSLSMMTPVAAKSLGAAGVAVQPPTEDPLPPPPDDRDRVGIGAIPIPVLAIWLGTIVAMIYIATRDDNDGLPTESPD